MLQQLTGLHALVSPISNGEDMRWDFIPPSADVHLNDGLGVNGVALVRVDGHTEQAGVGLEKLKF